jgi:hypothetical protein
VRLPVLLAALIFSLDSLLALEHELRDCDLAWEQRARPRCRLDEELITFYPTMALQFCAVPRFIPRDIDGDDEIAPFDPVFAANGKHGFVQLYPFGVAHSTLSVIGFTFPRELVIQARRIIE